MKTIEEIHAQLKLHVQNKLHISQELLINDPSFEEMNMDSLTKLELMFDADDICGSHVLEYIEDGLIDGDPPTRLSELAALIPLCRQPAKEFALQRQKNKQSEFGVYAAGTVK